jgi:DNA polymerase
MEKQKKEQALEILKETCKNCDKCTLATTRQQVVFGYGNPGALVMFIGEAPGADEDTQGKPFVGRAGKLLTTMMSEAGLLREKVYISNIAKCRPPQNRPPTSEESSTCKNLILFKEIEIINPLIICTLGSTATQALLGSTQINSTRGKLHSFNNIPLLPTYHPAYILRDPSKRDLVIADFKKIIQILKGIISDRKK